VPVRQGGLSFAPGALPGRPPPSPRLAPARPLHPLPPNAQQGGS